MSQNDPKTTSLITSVTKNLHPPTKDFFQVQSTRLADLFEPLNSSLAQSAEELGRWQGNRNMLFFRPKSMYEYIVRRFSKC